MIALVKPQFEAGKEAVPRGGVIRDPVTHAAVPAPVRRGCRPRLALAWHGLIALARSPGRDGNVEFLAHLAAPPGYDAGGAGDA